MITLDTELLYQTKYYELNIKRTNTDAYKSIDSYSDTHATKGASGSQTEENQDLDTNSILKELKLYMPRNRFKVLKLLKHSELVQLLQLLQKDKLILGLKFFTKAKLLRNIYNLSKEQILKILLQSFSKEEILSFMPIKALENFLGSSKINHGDMMKIIKSMPSHMLVQILESANGEKVGNMSQDKLISKVGSLNQGKLVESLKAVLPYKEMASFVGKLVENNGELLNEFSKNSLMKPIEKMGKSSIIESMQALDPSLIINMLKELPNNMLAMIDTMIDQDKLEEVLQKYNSDLLASLVA
jgi:Mg/Co/Ni transporter MgtE